jgi:WD40 repeat protein
MSTLSRKTCFVLLALFCAAALSGVLAAAGKSGGQLRPVGPATGVIYFWDCGLDPIIGAPGWPCRINPDGTGYKVLPKDKGLGKSGARWYWDVSHTSAPRFFVYEDRVTNVGVLTVADEDGSIERPLVSATGQPILGSRLAISQDDRRLAYCADGNLNVADLIYDPNDYVPYHLANCVSVATGVAPLFCTWSPDGTQIAFDQTAAQLFARTTRDIFVVTLKFDDSGNTTGGLAVQNITNSPEVNDCGAAWSPWLPDGTSRIADTAMGAIRSQDPIQTCWPDGGGLVVAVGRVNSGVSYHWYPSWSPDGTQIVFGALGGGNRQTQALMRSAADGTTTAFNLTGFSREMQILRVHWRP